MQRIFYELDFLINALVGIFFSLRLIITKNLYLQLGSLKINTLFIIFLCVLVVASGVFKINQRGSNEKKG